MRASTPPVRASKAIRRPISRVRDLPLTHGGSGQQQIGDSGTSDQQHQANDRHQDPQRLAILLPQFGIRISFGLRISVFGFSFASQRYRRVHPRCASGRDGRGKQRDGGQDGGVGDENERIGGGDAEQQTVQHACREPGRNQAQDYPYHGGLKANHRDWRTNLPVSLSLSERFFAGSKRGCV